MKTGDSVYVIAEAGVNHNGSVELARELTVTAVRAGADAVKFQTFRASDMVSVGAPKAEYQRKTTDTDESHLDMVRKLELSPETHRELQRHAADAGIEFLSSPFDSASLRLLTADLDLPLIKVPSGEITNLPFLLEVARSGKAVILSTGMSLLAEVESALAVLAYGYSDPSAPPSASAFRNAFCSSPGRDLLREKVVLLHCTTEYPSPYEDVNLRAMDTLRQAFELPTGLSDHTPGFAVPVAAVARGAVVIEKHLTLDKELPGPDHRASLDPNEFRSMVDAIRQVERALGSPRKVPASSELKNMPVARKSLVAGADIRKGERFTAENLLAKRPGHGLSPANYWEYLGRQAGRDYTKDELIDRHEP